MTLEDIALYARRFDGWLRDLPFGKFLALTLIFNTVINGIWVIPNIDVNFVFAKDIFSNPFPTAPDAQYILDNFLPAALAYSFHLNRSLASFIAMHVVVLIIGYVALGLEIRKKFGDETARNGLLLFSILPVSSCLFTWIGTDIFTWLLTSLCVVYTDLSVLFFLAFLLGLTHFEQGLFAMMAAVLVRCGYLSRERMWKESIAIFSGLLLAKLGLGFYFSWFHFDRQGNRSTIVFEFLHDPEPFLKVNFINFMPRLYTLFYGAALALVIVIKDLWPRERVILYRLGLGLLLLIGVQFVIQDQTRVFAITSWPVLLSFLVYLHKRQPQYLQSYRTGIGALAGTSIFLPKIIVWGGIHSSMQYWDVLCLLSLFHLHEFPALAAPFARY